LKHLFVHQANWTVLASIRLTFVIDELSMSGTHEWPKQSAFKARRRHYLGA
jgi:hypothetical protein